MSAVLIVLILIVIGFLGYQIGLRKGRPVLGACLGFVLGLIGLVIIAIIPRKQNTYNPPGTSRIS